MCGADPVPRACHRGRATSRARQYVAALSAVVALVSMAASTALAAGRDGEGGAGEQARPRTGAVASQPGADPDAARKAYLALLFQEINLRRDRAASPRFQSMAEVGNEAVNAYLHDLLPAMLQARTCFHGNDVAGLRAGWHYLEDVGIEASRVRGEVLACPDVNAGGFWTPPGIAEAWWKSASHRRTLYGDVRPRAVVCGAQAPIRDGAAYGTVACITLMGDG
jgi:hypothetical protein